MNATRMTMLAGALAGAMILGPGTPSANAGGYVSVDFGLIVQTFVNVLDNAFKYSKPDSSVEIVARKVERQIEIEVADRGVGIPSQDLQHVFDKFYRVTAADRVTGTGLGLSICKGIIQGHGGRIWAENLPDGFGFNFTVPLLLDGTSAPKLPMDPETE